MISISTRWACSPENVGSLCAYALGELRAYYGTALSEERLYDIELALSEACTNVMEHGYRWKAGVFLELVIGMSEKHIHFKVVDWAEEFKIDAVPTPNLNEPQVRGLGSYLLREVSDRLDYRREEARNVLTMTFLVGGKPKFTGSDGARPQEGSHERGI